MARPQYALTELVTTKPDLAMRRIRSAMRDAKFEYPAAAALLGMSTRQLRILCKRLEISDEILQGRRRVGGDRRGRPAIQTPPEKVLRIILQEVDGNMTEAARKLSTSVPTLTKWMEELGLTRGSCTP